MTRAVALALLIAACGGNRSPAPATTPAVSEVGDEPAAPRRTAELDHLFGELLPRWVVDLNQPQAAADPRVLRDAAAASLPDPVVARLEAALDAARAAREAPEPELDDATDRLDDAVAALDEALAGAGLGYVIDASVATSGDSRSVLLFSFAVDRLRRYTSDGAAFRALWVTRLDRLAFRYTLVGLAAQRRDVLILTAQIDEWLIGEILPALADPAAWRDGTDSPQLAGAVQTALARDLSAVAGAGLDELGAALDARRRLFDDIADRLADRGVSVERPATLALDADWRAALEPGLTGAERERLAAIEARLADLEVGLAYTRVRELAIAAVEHHEIQHQIDAPAALSAGPWIDHLGPDAAAVAARELSAYLAQIARHPASAHLSLVKLAGFALAGQTPPVERLVSRAIIAALARHLGAAADADSSEELTVTATALLSRDSSELSAAAAAVWTQRFGTPLAPLALE